eukprot:7860171-Pyramimonas_sp.AAC.1
MVVVVVVVVGIFLRMSAPARADPVFDGGAAQLLDPVAQALGAALHRHGGVGKVGHQQPSRMTFASTCAS